jgi:hypothetical protein
MTALKTRKHFQQDSSNLNCKKHKTVPHLQKKKRLEIILITKPSKIKHNALVKLFY